MANTPSYSSAAKAANLPTRIKMDALAALGVVTYLSAVGDSARLPDGTETDGFVVTVEATDGKQYESFVGAKVLVGALGRLTFPFTARVVKSGPSWIFSD